ncbi:electron transfer flavoprotein subunit beta/FixA family protein [Brevibacterium sp. 50QC2O2]|jgi:electron transfer flavoprotein beta subunit|uniref:electron transfer flavoprotein subunit beta/FixA family protein n=1 Tax=Brevibacterium TaxID=1696 RepID=UPI00211C0A0B|nr:MULTISPECIES: electron transfer flavoprotein subunit beta/FixA family protein [unclassified Brevibacterium]MCQ9368032.1 electron transfer flavoprotein subunit beta/FixA family protein [Brevibacterium sp. 91QC2O2]MCQ9385234.1 electron transfer flavoprotein subunit beta/FixA family protein [Brevibacterium sp. 68QC2CO]MCQ9388740.1 electron transfer flavoprotein subunit beta/FixA family protein [Brevibacterium sp. 50QC2O2]
MRIVTFVKYVPDAAGDRTFESDNTVDRSVDGLLSELDEYAVEEALKITGGDKSAEVIALTVGGDDAKDAVKKALQMGATKGVHVNDDALDASDAIGTARVLAAALKQVAEDEGPIDLVLTGFASTDAGMSVVPTLVAELSGLPALTQVSQVTVSGTTVNARRDGDTSSQFLEAALPALVSVTDQTNEPRYPSFKGILGAKRKKIAEYDLSDLGVAASEVGRAGATTQVVEVAERPARTAGEIITDEGDGGTKLVEWLAAKKLV